MALLVLEMGLKPSEKTPYPVSITYPARSLNLLISSVTSNVSLTTWSQVGNCCLSSTIRGTGLPKKCSTLDNYCVIYKIISHEMHKGQCWSFQLMVLCYRPICLYSKGTWWLSEMLPLSLSLRSCGLIPIKSSSLQLQLDILETASSSESSSFHAGNGHWPENFDYKGISLPIYPPI